MDRAGGPWRAVLFDVEGVIAHTDREAIEPALDRRWPGLTWAALQTARNAAALYPAWERYSCGRIDPDDYWGAVLRGLDLSDDPDAVSAMRAIQAEAAWSVLDEDVLDVVSALRAARVPVGILSNSAADYESHIALFEMRFDAACFSHRTGMRKPDREAYVAAARALGVEPDDVVFVDDKPRNIVAAASIGMRPIQFAGARHLARELVALGLLPAAS